MKKVYKPKALVDGYKLSAQLSGKQFIAVPQRKAEGGYMVAFENKIMRISGKNPVERLKFTDKYGRKDYWLYYYEWIPEPIWK